MTNYDPAAKTMIFAKDGSMYDRALIDPDRNNWGPRLGLAYSMTPRTVVRGGWGMSYIHFHRIGAANILSINGPQVVNAVVSQSNPTLPTFRTTQQGYPAGLADPSQFNPLTANILYIPRDYHSSVVQSWYVSVQREIAKNMLVDVAYVGNRADDLLSLANYNQAVPNNAAGSLSLQARRPIQEFGDITYTSNDGKSRYNALQVKFEYRMPGNLMLLNAFTWSQAKDNGAGSLEAPNGNIAGPQDFYNREADYAISGYNQPLNNTTSFVWDLPFGRDRRWMNDANAVVDAFVGGWTFSGINTMTSGAPVTLTYTPAASFVVSGITQEFRGREQLPAQRHRRPVRRQELDHGLLQPDQRGHPHRSEPGLRQRRAQHRERPVVLAAGLRGVEELQAPDRPADQPADPHRGVQPAQQDELHRAERQPQFVGVRHHHVHL